MLSIREFNEADHTKGVASCLIELQDFERSLDPRMPSGADIVDLYIPNMLDRCIECDGKVLVAEVEGEVAGYVTVLARVSSDEIEDGDVEYGLIPDLVVASRHRKKGIGRKLLEAAEAYAKSNDVKSLRIGVLARNRFANDMYESMGFESTEVPDYAGPGRSRVVFVKEL